MLSSANSQVEWNASGRSESKADLVSPEIDRRVTTSGERLLIPLRWRTSSMIVALVLVGCVSCQAAGQANDLSSPGAASPAATATSSLGPAACPRVLAGRQFPSTFPVYPNATLVLELACSGFGPPLAADSVESYGRWLTPDSGQQVISFYDSRLAASGWEVMQSVGPEPDGSAAIGFASRNAPDINDSLIYRKASAGGVIMVSIWT